jgi:hypothetical protein
LPAATVSPGGRFGYYIGCLNQSFAQLPRGFAMKFIEMTGHTLFKIVSPEEAGPLHGAGVTDHCLLRVNLQGDIEIRRRSEWGVIGGLLGDFEERIKQATGLDWA